MRMVYAFIFTLFIGLSLYSMESPVASSVYFGLFFIDQQSYLWQLKNGMESAEMIGHPQKFSSVVAGGRHVLALDESGDVWSLGRGSKGQLGNECYDKTDILQRIQSLKDVVSISAGAYTSYVLDKHGKVWTFGSNESGELGRGDINCGKSPICEHISGLSNVIFLSPCMDFSYHIYALDNENKLWGWGSNLDHRLVAGRDEEHFFQPLFCSEYKDIQFVSSGWYNSAFIDTAGNLYISRVKQIGNISLLGNLVMVKITRRHIFVLNSEGNVWFSELGNISIDTVNFSLIHGLTDIIWIGTNNKQLLALDRTGGLFTAGDPCVDAELEEGVIPCKRENIPLIRTNNSSSFVKSARKTQQ